MKFAVVPIGFLLLIGEIEDNMLVNPAMITIDLSKNLVGFIDFKLFGNIDLSNYMYIVVDNDSELARVFRMYRLGIVPGGFGNA